PRPLDLGDAQQRVAGLDRLADQRFLRVEGDHLARQRRRYRGLARRAARLQQDVALGEQLAQLELLVDAVARQGVLPLRGARLAELLAEEGEALLRRTDLDRELIDLELRLEVFDEQDLLPLGQQVARLRPQVDDLASQRGIDDLTLLRQQ